MKISEQKLRESFRNGELATKLPINIYNTTSSTNKEAREYIVRLDTDCALFIAGTQTAGRGRLGRSFSSEPGGLYMTLLVKLDEQIQNPVFITAYTAVTVRRAIEELCGLSAKIKWVNDIILNGRKLGGILTEGVLCPDTSRVKYAIVGIGVNVFGTELPCEIADIATTLELSGAVTTREELAARITELFISNLKGMASAEIIKDYRHHCMLIGKDITVIKKSCQYPATVLGISDNCELILELENGEYELLYTGEVSVRIK